MTIREELRSLVGDFRRYLDFADRPVRMGAADSRAAARPASRAARAPGPAVMRRKPPRVDTLEALRAEALECTRCPLHRTRKNVVFGEGNPGADIMFIGEAPGRDEDLQGRPFVGRAGQLLTRILAAIDLRREDVFIGNVLKCRPPGNRDPAPEESVACMPLLERQIELIRPKIVCALGRIAGTLLLGQGRSLASMRGSIHRWGPGGEVKLIVTYHPAACLRNPEYKRPVWEDMQRLRDEYHALCAAARS